MQSITKRRICNSAQICKRAAADPKTHIFDAHQKIAVRRHFAVAAKRAQRGLRGAPQVCRRSVADERAPHGESSALLTSTCARCRVQFVSRRSVCSAAATQSEHQLRSAFCAICIDTRRASILANARLRLGVRRDRGVAASAKHADFTHRRHRRARKKRFASKLSLLGAAAS